MMQYLKDRFVKPLCLFLMLILLLPCALADDWEADQITDDWGMPQEVYDQIPQIVDDQTVPVVVTPAYNMERGDITLGYVAGSGASPHPLFCNEWDLMSISRLLYEDAIELDENLRPTPNLISGWTHEGKTWTLTLRNGITFHNGMELNAFDVVASFNAFKNSGSDNPYHARTNLITSVKAADDFTLTVTGKYEGYITLYGMVFPVMQQYTLQDEIPSGTGPYWIVNMEYNRAIRLEANPFWWRIQPRLKSIVCRCYTSSADLLEAFNTGRIDTLMNRSAAAAMTSQLSDVASRTFTTLSYEYLLPNLDEESVMSNIDMRRAIINAIDFTDLVTTGYHNTCQTCEVPMISSGWLYESQSAAYTYSPERAFSLVTGLGWEDLNGDGILNKLKDVKLEELTVRIITYNDSNSTVRESAANLIAMYLSRVGINAKVTVLSSLDKVKVRIKSGDYDLALLSLCVSETPGYRGMIYTNGSANLNHYTSAEMDRLLDDVYAAPTEDELIYAMSRVQLKTVEDLPFIGIGFRTGRVIASHSLSKLRYPRAYHILNGIEFMDIP